MTTSDGLNLTFSGTIASFTLQQNEAYGLLRLLSERLCDAATFDEPSGGIPRASDVGYSRLQYGRLARSNNGYALLADTLNEIEVFAPGGTSVLRRINIPNPVALVAAPDGTPFVSSFPVGTAVGTNATYVVAPGATSGTQITSLAEPSIVLYNGYQESDTQWTSVAARIP